MAVKRPIVKNGENKADFINCVAFGKTAENLCKYMGKGSMIGIEGQIQTSTFTDNSGVKRYQTNVVIETIEFLESKRQNEPEADISPNTFMHENETQESPGYETSDDLPF